MSQFIRYAVQAGGLVLTVLVSLTASVFTPPLLMLGGMLMVLPFYFGTLEQPQRPSRVKPRTGRKDRARSKTPDRRTRNLAGDHGMVWDTRENRWKHRQSPAAIEQSLDALAVQRYLDADPLDPTATLGFLEEVDTASGGLPSISPPKGLDIWDQQVQTDLASRSVQRAAGLISADEKWQRKRLAAKMAAYEAAPPVLGSVPPWKAIDGACSRCQIYHDGHVLRSMCGGECM